MVNDKSTKNTEYKKKEKPSWVLPVPPSIRKPIADLQEQRLAWTLSVPPSIGKQIAELQEQRLAWALPIPPSIGKQIAELQEQRLAWALPIPPSIGKQIAELQEQRLAWALPVPPSIGKQIAELQEQRLAWALPIPPSIRKLIADLQEQRLAWTLSVPPSIGKQIAELQYTTLNFRAKIMSDNMPIKESLANMDEVFSTIQQEIENSNLVEEAFTIQGYVMNYLDYTIKELQKIYNTLETKKVRTILLDIMTIISFILSFKSSIIDSPPEVHIHNKYEDIKIDTEIDGERIDMYIEKKGSLNEEKREQEEEYKLFSGGERT